MVHDAKAVHADQRQPGLAAAGAQRRFLGDALREAGLPIARGEDDGAAGPLRDAEGNFTGSLVVVKAESEEDARAFLTNDPYFKADIWSSIEIRAFNAAAGDWVGGKTW
jgi:hypothetical protein